MIVARRGKQGWIFVAVLVIAGLVLAGERVRWNVHAEHARPPAAGILTPVRLTLAPGNGLDAAALKRIAGLVASDRAFARDVAFLLVASLRERCNPAHAGELAEMAGRARLPVLAATAGITAKAADLDRPIYRFVQRLSDAAPCGRSLDLQPIGLNLQLDPETYAATFPDSYYQPALRAVPKEYGNEPLGRRARQGCQAIGYAVLPLGVANWHCARLRASMRRQIRQACEAERTGDADAGEVAATTALHLAGPVARLVQGLPRGCG